MYRQFRRAARSLLHRPLFAATVVATLAVGLGSSTAMFNVVDAVLLRSLPFAEPQRLVSIWETVHRDTIERRSFAYPDFLDLRDQATSFESAAAYDAAFFDARGGARAERLQAAIVTSNYFQVLGAAPALGAGFESGRRSSVEDASGTRQVVLSYGYWRSRFGGDNAILGKLLELDGSSYMVTGVMPQGFVPLVEGAKLWIAFEELPRRYLQSRSSRWHSVVARLAPGATEDAARRELAKIFAGLEESYPDRNAHYSANLGPLSQELVGDLRAPLITLLVSVGLVLLVACANVAGLLLVHAARRAPETALRKALGATRWSLLKDRAVETVLLGALGGTLGVGLATVLTRVLLRSSPIELPSFVSLALGPRMLVFAGALSLMVGVALALGSAALRAQEGTAKTLRSGTSRARASQPVLTALLVGELALATVLVVGAGLLVSSLGELLRVDPGFESEHLAFVEVGLPPQSGPGGQQHRARQREQLLETAAAVPGVRRAALATDAPLQGGYSATVVSGADTPLAADRPWGGATRVYRHLVTPGYFDTLGIPVLRGRGVEITDRGASQPVVVVTEAFAQKMWPGQRALGQRLKLGRPLEPDADVSQVSWLTVVGVVADHRFRSLVPDAGGAPEDPDIYFPMEQQDPGDVVVAVATDSDPAPALSTLRLQLERLDPDLVVFNAETVGERLFRETARSRFASSLLAGFAAVTLFLAALGIYGMVGYQVAARLREIGIRMALGASGSRVVGDVVRAAARWMVFGVVAGLVTAGLAVRLLRSQLYGVAPLEPRVYLVATLLLLGAGIVAALVPGLRAGRVDPATVLRGE